MRYGAFYFKFHRKAVSTPMITFSYREKEVSFPNVGKMYRSYFDRNQFYEHDFLEYIDNLQLEGTYLDVGCNIGNHLLYFSQFTKAEKVIGFEPLPQYVKLIEETIRLNDIGHKARVQSFAASNETGPFQLTFNNRSYSVLADRIDNLRLEDVRLAKFDVEGMEPQAIDGARETLQRCRPIVFVEANTAEEFDNVSATLADLDYVHTGNVFNASPTYEFIFSR